MPKTKNAYLRYLIIHSQVKRNRYKPGYPTLEDLIQSLEDEEPRIFGLDRITNLTISDRYFIQDPAFYDEIFRVLYDAVGVMAFGIESQDVVLRFNNAEAPYVKTLMLHRSQKVLEEDDAGITVSLHVKVTPEFIRDCILRYGDCIKVISPVQLADTVQLIYHRALDAYNQE